MTTTICRLPVVYALIALSLVLGTKSQAQITSVVFQDDFSSNTIDPGKYQADAPFFEGGEGDVHAVAGSGVMKFVGTTTKQWWSGGTLRVVPTFTATEQANLIVSVDRVAEAGVGTASRSALWILDETKQYYVLFADVRAEGGWHYNRKINDTGDVPTGSGTDIAAFNGGTFDNGGLHKMKMVADGKTVKLYLDGVLGVEVKFPFSKVVLEFGSYARANNDTADTTWDNLKIEQTRPTSVVFSDDFSSNTLPAAKYVPDAPFFEGGVGDIHGVAENGTLHFIGTTSQQWWSGGTVRIAQSFPASDATTVAVTVDRVSEKGVGTASRSALWILDETRQFYVLFADVRGEGGWHYNRKINDTGDVPTGSGTDIAAFNGGTFDNGGLHRMKAIADGKTVKLYLDDVFGVEVKFPFSSVVFELGSYARANNDTADTTWDNLKIETTVRQTTVLFSDDFSTGLNTNLYVPDAPFFEGGVGDVHASASTNGTIQFTGKTTQQWWSGGTLRLTPTFTASAESVLTLTIDRVAEKGVGTASRSALWILDDTKTKYVLFADVRGEGGWRYNRNIGENGDVPTGSGTDIAAFNGGTFDDGGPHKMSMIADGKTVKLLLDGIQGAEVKFPFSNVLFEFGSYARANNDTADTTWDNLRIESAGGASFAQNAVGVRAGQSTSFDIRIPKGLNSQNAVQLKVVSSDPKIAMPEGTTNGTLLVTIPVGAPNTLTLRVKGLAVGVAQLSIEGDLASVNKLDVAVLSGPGVQLQDAFAGSVIDTNKWVVDNTGFESGTGTFTAAVTGGVLEIQGSVDAQYWPGAGVRTAKTFIATKDLNLAIDADRVLLEPNGTGGRTGIYITTANRAKFVFFGQNSENNWEVNVNPGNPTGGGTVLTAFADVVDNGPHHLRMVADGQNVEVFLDGKSGGKFPFEASSGISFLLGAYARDVGDTVRGDFDNVQIENILPCVQLSAQTVTMTAADLGKTVQITIPALLNDIAAASFTATSRDPKIATIGGSSSASSALNFAAGTPNSQTITITPVGLGSTTIDLTTSDKSVCLPGSIRVEVVALPEVLLSDSFSTNKLDATKWRQDETPFDSGTFLTDVSGIAVTNGQVVINVTAESAAWPGLALFTVPTFSVTATTPATFEIDRNKLGFVLVTGTGANERAGIWVKDPTGAFVFFSDNVAHDGRNYGWVYNAMVGAANDNPTDAGVNIGAFDGPKFDEQGPHRMKMVVNGVTAKLYLDDILGAEVPFPFSKNLSFGFGAYVAAATDIVTGIFDNATVLGGSAPVPARLSASLQGANLTITWTGTGTLEEATQITGPWTATANGAKPYTAAISGARKFYRVR